MKKFPRVVLLQGKDRSVRLFHPWLFSGAISKVEGNPEEGEIVEVFSKDGEYLATGHFHDGSIKVRIFSFEQTDANQDFWNSKFLNAFQFRQTLGITNDGKTNTYRLIHGEGDNLPGLIIDIYDSAAVIQFHTYGMYRMKELITNALKNIPGLKLEVIYNKSSETINSKKFPDAKNEFLLGDLEEKIILENDIRFHVNWVEGQKTGYFIDQRENRLLLEKYSKGKNVLNTFSYSGGFSMYALHGGAVNVHSVDSSKKASELANLNAQLNGYQDKHVFYQEDVFDFLKKSNDKYDIVILDPPAFAKHLSSVKNAMVGYRNLNVEGIDKVAKGGLLFTFSCSQVIDKLLFRKLIFQAAAQTKRNIRIMHQLTQAPDHPVNIYHPEGEYLKGLVLMVE